MTADEKRCRRCDQTLPASAFSRNSAAADGLQYWCDRCRAEDKANRKAGLVPLLCRRCRREFVKDRPRQYLCAPCGEQRDRERPSRPQSTQPVVVGSSVPRVRTAEAKANLASARDREHAHRWEVDAEDRAAAFRERLAARLGG